MNNGKLLRFRRLVLWPLAAVVLICSGGCTPGATSELEAAFSAFVLDLLSTALAAYLL